jgi:TetR/AcrR family transcriptional regulator
MSISEWKEKEKAQRRQEIINLAENLFIARGYDGVTMEEVAKQAGLAIGTLYLYFRNKESLFSAVVVRRVAEFNSLLREAANKGSNGAEKLNATGEALYEFYKNYPGVFQIFVHDLQSTRFSGDDENTRELARLSKENFQITQQLIEEGIADGSLRPDLNPMMTTFFGIIALQNIIGLHAGFEAMFRILGLSHEEFVHYSRDLVARSIANTTTKR